MKLGRPSRRLMTAAHWDVNGMSAGGQALTLTSGARLSCGTAETDPAVLALYHEECNATDLEVWTALPLDISATGLPSKNLIVHGYTVQSYSFSWLHKRVQTSASRY